jgi:glycosyltransferase involved in cell wall biosynthesis
MVSVITVNLNHSKGLKATLESVQKQNWKPIEHIIVDGGSSDDSLAVVAQFPHVAQCISEKDNGIYHAQNKGWKMATGQYCLFLNSGDLLYDAHTISSLMDPATPRTVVYGNIYVEQEDGSLVLKEYPSSLNDNFFQYDTPPHCCTLIPRKLLEARGGYDESMHICADWKFFRGVHAARLANFVHVPGACSVFEHGGMSARPQNRHEIVLERQRVKAAEKTLPARIKRKADSLLAKYGLWIPQL